MEDKDSKKDGFLAEPLGDASCQITALEAGETGCLALWLLFLAGLFLVAARSIVKPSLVEECSHLAVLFAVFGVAGIGSASLSWVRYRRSRRSLPSIEAAT